MLCLFLLFAKAVDLSTDFKPDLPSERQRATEKKAPEIISDTIGPIFSQDLSHNFKAPSGLHLIGWKKSGGKKYFVSNVVLKLIFCCQVTKVLVFYQTKL